MKKFILSFLIYIIGVTSVFSQTYQELSDRAIVCTEQDSLAQAENYIRHALKLEPANHIMLCCFLISVLSSGGNGIMIRLWNHTRML